ncbi:MAG: hypothetical protein R3Y50_10520, partial [Rikenellaceae bacterium]
VWSQVDNTTKYYFPESGETTFYAVADQCPAEIEKDTDTGVDVNNNSTGKALIGYVLPSDIEKQPTLMTAKVERAAGDKSSVKFNLKHELTALSFSASGDYTIESLTMSKFKFSGTFYIADNSEWMDQGTTSTEFEVITNGATTGNLTSETGYIMLPIQNAKGITITAKVKYTDGDKVSEKTIKTTLDEKDLLAGHYYNYNVVTGDYVAPDEPSDEGVGKDFTTEDESANCYILNPSETEALTFYIPVEERINTFWGEDYANVYANMIVYDNDAYNPMWTPQISWGDVDSFEGITVERVTEGFEFDGAGSAMKVTIPANCNQGNIVVNVERNDIVVWSWHLWITDYNPDAVISVTNPYISTVSGGEIHRYRDNDGYKVWSDTDLYIMDRNIGARSNKEENGATLGTLYYQWGRKDPFTTNAKNYDNTKFNIITNKTFTYISESVNNPTAFSFPATYLTGYNWHRQSVSGLWHDWNSSKNDSKKSIFDPSPLGWKVANGATWADFYATWGETIGTTDKATQIYNVCGAYYPHTGFMGANGEVLKSDATSIIWSESGIANYNSPGGGTALFYGAFSFLLGEHTSNEADVLYPIFNDNTYSGLGYSGRRTGMPIRCVKVTD